MKILCVLPSRYQSSRLPGKPLLDICGKPMIWWVYQKVSSIKDIDCIVATDDERIANTCGNYNIPFLMTGNHNTHVERIHEVSTKIPADYYLCVCGDEPLIEPNVIQQVIPEEENNDKPYVKILNREITEPTEVIDPGNIKAAINKDDKVVMLSRSPIPYPYKTIMYKYRKIMGVECYNKKALDLFVSNKPGTLEKIEDVTLLRFIENLITIDTCLVNSISLSVDTNKDLEKVRIIIKKQIDSRDQ